MHSLLHTSHSQIPLLSSLVTSVIGVFSHVILLSLLYSFLLVDPPGAHDSNIPSTTLSHPPAPNLQSVSHEQNVIPHLSQHIQYMRRSQPWITKPWNYSPCLRSLPIRLIMTLLNILAERRTLFAAGIRLVFYLVRFLPWRRMVLWRSCSG